MMPAAATECSICPKIVLFTGVTHFSTWEPAVREDKISLVYSNFSPDHPQSSTKAELAVWLIIHSSSQSRSAPQRAT